MATDREQLTDEQLMARVAARLDGDAMRQLLDRHAGRATSVAARLLHNRTAGEDAVQDAMLRVVRHRSNYQAGQPFTPWFYTILRRVCVDMLRRRSRERAALDRLAAEAPAAAEPASSSGGEILETLNQLPRGERDVLALRIIEQLPFNDIGAALGITAQAARKRAQRGLDRLRRRMSDQRAGHHRAG